MNQAASADRLPLADRVVGREPARSAQNFVALAPAALAPYVEQVWLGMPAPCRHASEHTQRRSAVIPLAALAHHRRVLLDAMVLIYGGDPEKHARALLSQWSKYYFGLVAPAAVVAAWGLRCPLDMSLARTHLRLEDGMPTALYFADDALGPTDTRRIDRYRPFIEHLREVIETLCAMTRIAPRVLWSNAANLLDYLFAQCAADANDANDANEEAAWLFSVNGCDGNGEPNPLYAPLREVHPRSMLLPNPFRARRVCCVRYEIPGETQLCGSCPLLLTMNDETLALQNAVRCGNALE